MNKTYLCVLALAACLCLAIAEKREEKKEKRVVFTTAAVALAVIPAVTKLFNNILTNINGPNNVKDHIIYGRAMRITAHDATSATVKDLGTGITATKAAASSAQAAGEATAEVISELIKTGHIDEHTIPNVPDDPTPSPQQCHDFSGARYCSFLKSRGQCTPHGPATGHVLRNCFFSCACCNLNPCPITF